MLTSVLALMTATSVTAVDLHHLQQTVYTRPDSAYIGESITCANATYCVDQQQLYNASVNDDLTYAPRYVVQDASAVAYNATQMNLTLTMTNSPPITAWQPGNDLTLTMNIYQNGLL